MNKCIRSLFPKKVMSSGILAGLAALLLLAGGAETMAGEGGKETEAERIPRLIGQLGDDKVSKREAAEKELQAIGGPALAALQAAASGSDDTEVKKHAERLVAAIQREIPKRELARIEGTWVRQTAEANGNVAPKDDPPVRYVLEGGSVKVLIGDQVKQEATWTIVEAAGDTILVDYSITGGVNQGTLVRGIYTIRGDDLRWCYRFAPEDRPAAFSTQPGDNISLVTLKREPR